MDETKADVHELAAMLCRVDRYPRVLCDCGSAKVCNCLGDAVRETLYKLEEAGLVEPVGSEKA